MSVTGRRPPGPAALFAIVLAAGGCEPGGVPAGATDGPMELSDGGSVATDLRASSSQCTARVITSDGVTVDSECEVLPWGPDSLGNFYLTVWNENSPTSGMVAIEFDGIRSSIVPGTYHLGDFPVLETLRVRFERSNPLLVFAPLGGKGEMTLVLSSYEPATRQGTPNANTHGSLDAMLPGTIPGSSATLHIGF